MVVVAVIALGLVSVTVGSGHRPISDNVVSATGICARVGEPNRLVDGEQINRVGRAKVICELDSSQP